MKLFHGGLIPVKEPKILSADRIGDFGIGFYTTSSEEQARRFVQSKAARQNVAEGCLSIYDVPDDFLHNDFLRVQTFKAADEEWVDFVLKNRRQPDFCHDYDIVAGPVANDQVYASFALYENDLISKTELLERLKARRLVDQILFHTEKSLLILNFTDSEVIRCRK